MNILQRCWLGPLLLGVFALATPPTVDAQILVPPINGLTATIALPSTVDAFYKGLNEGLEKAGDGIDHLTRARGTKGREGSGSLGSLRPGTAVAVQYTVKGIQASADEIAPVAPNALNVNEGTSRESIAAGSKSRSRSQTGQPRLFDRTIRSRTAAAG
jgi:hypothetical protein